MDTGQWTSNGTGFPNVLGTLNIAIGPGGVSYAKGSWVDGAMTKVAFPNANVTTYPFVSPAAGQTASQIWNDYRSKIDQGLTVVVSWDKWVI